MKATQTDTVILTAAVLGTIAFKEGRKSIPAQDKEMMKLIAGNASSAIPAMRAYHAAFHAANLANA